jgi:glycerol uptake facilitator-like aquaporin
LTIRALAGEAVGTAMLLTAVVGSGIMAERLSGGNVGLALLANAIATGGALFALIHTFAAVSGAHFNPLVTLAAMIRGEMSRGRALGYIVVQIVGGIFGVWVAHLMFALPILQTSAHDRTDLGQWAGEFVASFGLMALIESGRRHFAASLPATIAAYITGAYWFTSSTSFANPAVTIARSFTDTFAGISPPHVPGFIIAQLLGGFTAVALFNWLFARR